MRVLLPLLIAIHFALGVHAQNYEPILRSLGRGEYQRGKALLQKILRKSPQDPGALFIMGQYFFDPVNPEQNLDSAQTYAFAAYNSFQSLKPEEAKRIEANLINGHELALLKARIELRAFEIADSIGTEDSFDNYVKKFPTSEHLPVAILKRDKLAFAAAQKTATYQAYAEFLAKYPESIYAQEAQQQYETLLYQAMTEQGTEEQYRAFVKNYPASPYAGEAIFQIYRLSTVSNSANSLIDIILNYPNSPQARQAIYRLAYLEPEKLAQFRSHPEYVAVAAQIAADTIKLLAFWGENKKFGFMNLAGEPVIEPVFESVSRSYLCEGSTENFLLLPQKNGSYLLCNKLGKPLDKEGFESAEAATYGLVKVSRKGLQGFWHLGGFEAVPCHYENLEVLTSTLIRYEKNGRYGLLGHTGQVLTEPLYDQLHEDNLGTLIFVSQGQCTALSEAAFWALYQPGKLIAPQLPFDDCKPIAGRVVAQKDGLFQLIDPKTSQPLIQNAQHCSYTPYGWLVRIIDRWTLHSHDGKMLGKRGFDSLLVGQGLVAFRTLGFWGVADSTMSTLLEAQYDSVVLASQGSAVLHKGKEHFAYFKGYKPLIIPDFVSLQFKSYGDSAQRVLLVARQKNGKCGLWNMAGVRLLPAVYDEIIFTPYENIFIIRLGKLRGLIGQSGKWLAVPQFHGLVYLKNGWFATFKDGLFGLICPAKKISIAPQYTVQPRFYNDSLLLVKKQKLAILYPGRALTELDEFDQVYYWCDTAALVFHQSKWKIFDFVLGRFDVEFFDRFEPLPAVLPGEVRLKTYRSSGFGVLSSHKGRLIAEEFTGINDIGEPGRPLYLVEKHIPQASIYVLLYYNGSGNIIKRQVINDPIFERYSCLD